MQPEVKIEKEEVAEVNLVQDRQEAVNFFPSGTGDGAPDGTILEVPDSGTYFSSREEFEEPEVKIEEVKTEKVQMTHPSGTGFSSSRDEFQEEKEVPWFLRKRGDKETLTNLQQDFLVEAAENGVWPHSGLSTFDRIVTKSKEVNQAAGRARVEIEIRESTQSEKDALKAEVAGVKLKASERIGFLVSEIGPFRRAGTRRKVWPQKLEQVKDKFALILPKPPRFFLSPRKNTAPPQPFEQALMTDLGLIMESTVRRSFGRQELRSISKQHYPRTKGASEASQMAAGLALGWYRLNTHRGTETNSDGPKFPFTSIFVVGFEKNQIAWLRKP